MESLRKGLRALRRVIPGTARNRRRHTRIPGLLLALTAFNHPKRY